MSTKIKGISHITFICKDIEKTALPGRKRELAEGCSIYFYDYDNHLFELHAGNLDDRLRYYYDEKN